MKILRIVGLLTITGSLVFGVGCSLLKDPLQTEARSIQRGDASAAAAKVTMNSGTLLLTGGAEKLLNAEFRFSDDACKPLVEYGVYNGEGKLSVKQLATKVDLNGINCEWNLRLNSDVPTDLDVNLGMGKSEIKLGNLALNDFDVQAGYGELTLDMLGGLKRNLDTTVSGEAGRLVVKVPRDVGVKVDLKKPTSTVQASDFRKEGDSYMNEAYGAYRLNWHISVEGEAGEIRLEQAK